MGCEALDHDTFKKWSEMIKIRELMNATKKETINSPKNELILTKSAEPVSEKVKKFPK